MKETPLLMRGHLVVATLRDLKTQTRRTNGLDLVNDRPQYWRYDGLNIHGDHCFFDCAAAASGHDLQDCVKVLRCPYGQPGDRLWVKEAHRLCNCECNETCRVPGHVWYEADQSGYENVSLERLRPSIHMPRWASRLTLKITRIRVEQIADISLGDCLDEGIQGHGDKDEIRGRFKTLWDSINAKRGLEWMKNPWVWAITFKRL